MPVIHEDVEIQDWPEDPDNPTSNVDSTGAPANTRDEGYREEEAKTKKNDDNWDQPSICNFGFTVGQPSNAIIVAERGTFRYLNPRYSIISRKLLGELNISLDGTDTRVTFLGSAEVVEVGNLDYERGGGPRIQTVSVNAKVVLSFRLVSKDRAKQGAIKPPTLFYVAETEDVPFPVAMPFGGVIDYAERSEFEYDVE